MRIIGHRGARGEAPENTLGGFKYIHEIGIRAVEFDVRQLNDQSLIVMHDDNFIRTTGQQKPVNTCCTEDLCLFDQAHSWDSWDSVEVTPLLNQTLPLIQHFDHIEVEVKAVKNQQDAENIVIALHQYLQGFEHNAVITSFDTKIHQALKQHQSVFRRGLLIETDLKHQGVELALDLGCSQIGWMNELATDEIIEATQQAQLRTSVWTVNDLKRAQTLHDLGVDGLITDFPLKMKTYFDL